MNKLFFCLLVAAAIVPRISYATNEVLSTFKDPSVECDYLIVTIQDYEKPAIALAQHRNSYKFDDVEHAKVVFLPEILAEFPGYDYNHRNIALWRGLKWSRENWKKTFKYLILMGNDAFDIRILDSATFITSEGAIPTWYLDTVVINLYTNRKNVPVQVTDDLYINLSAANPPTDIESALGDPNLSIGRIPAATALQCSIYVEKVKFYDLARPQGARRNNVLAIADDAMEGVYLDPLQNFHQFFTERIVTNSLQGYSVTKRYNSAYPLDQFYEKPQAKEAIIQTLNTGVSWAYFYGHGSEQVLTDEQVLTSETIDRISNDSMPFVFISFTAGNGSFWASTPSSMCLKYLFSSEGGAIAYIASPCPTGAFSNDVLGSSFFSEAKKDPAGSLGALLARAKLKANSLDNFSYFLLGDPALRVSTGVLPVAVKLVPDTNPTHVQLLLQGVSSDVNYSVTFTVRDSVIAAPVSQSLPDLSFSRDSAISTVSGVFHDSTTIALPKGVTVPIKTIVYVWNDTTDGRAEVICTYGSANPVVWMPVRKVATGRPTLRKIRGGLAIAGLEAGVNRIRIFDVLGRNVYNGEIVAGTGVVSIDLASKRLRTGRYVLQVKGRAFETAVPFVYMAGE